LVENYATLYKKNKWQIITRVITDELLSNKPDFNLLAEQLYDNLHNVHTLESSYPNLQRYKDK